ncbi:hypothetical protein GGX14DRAFT_634045 [Mycena pura]|uniref:Uncharacterized protein n=1 Tax=Mycena pura TaxID=153505 RepID=A0AAD6VIY7_9AGAR|nr:hypothetical protein GGX14DRAFT_634045 [Mycena pura]
MATACDKCGHRNTDATIIVLDGHNTADQRTALAQIDAEILRFRTYAEGHALPKLRRLEANVSETRFRDLVPLQTPLPLLQHLAARLLSEDLRDILKCAPDLRHLTTRSLSPDLYSESLVSLELTGTVSYPADVFLGDIFFPYLWTPLGLGVLEFLTLPNLTHLEFSQPLHLEIIEPFLSRSGCAIKHLCCFIGSELEAFKTSLEIFPWVETLEITLDDEGYTHLFGLALYCLDLSVMSLVPLLRKVVIIDAPLYFDFSRIVDILKRRRELRSFHLVVYVVLEKFGSVRFRAIFSERRT